MLVARPGENIDEVVQVKLTEYFREEVFPPLSRHGLIAQHGPCNPWMMERMKQICSRYRIPIIADSNFRGFMSSHLEKKDRLGSYEMPHGLVCICIEEGWRGGSKEVTGIVRAACGLADI